MTAPIQMRELKCPQCRTLFYRSVRLKQIQKFCSKDCSIASRAIKSTCSCCEKEFTRERINNKYCSMLCYALARRKYENERHRSRVRNSIDYQIDLILRKLDLLNGVKSVSMS